jgi:hypothetical protein
MYEQYEQILVCVTHMSKKELKILKLLIRLYRKLVDCIILMRCCNEKALSAIFVINFIFNFQNHTLAESRRNNKNRSWF